MKNFISTTLMTIVITCVGQDLTGAWKWSGTDENGQAIIAVAIVTEGYQSATWYDLENKEFIRTNGGSWAYEDGVLTETIEFDTEEPDRVGTTVSSPVSVENDVLTLTESGEVWKRIDDNTPGALAGAWLISGRMRDGEISERSTDRPRKTMKILSGTRFQWIAYNTETKQFMGTGGGTYTTEDGKYIENIEFFSRDNSRVGASLVFDFEIKDGKWHHSGKSSKGDPMYELWSPRTK